MAATGPYISKYTLNNAVQMPGVGFGTYRIRDASTIMQVVDYALAAGYRMFDTAEVYGNEGYLNNAFRVLLPKYGLEREDLFITTKLSPSHNGDADSIKKAFQRSLDNLGLKYIDLYLIHFPGAARISANDKRNRQMRSLTWQTLEELYDDGNVKSIGVSNFTVKHLTELLSEHERVPAVNQVEWHPYYHQSDLLKYCNENNIVLQAYCSLGGTSISNCSLIQDPVVVKVAHMLNVTSAQVLLAWALNKGVAVIPKSTNAGRIKENLYVNFKIPESDLKALDMLGKNNIKYAWDPNAVA